MAYDGIIRHCLISCPGDVPREDLAIVRLEINRWNGVYGPKFRTSITPISWGTHAAAEFGQPPQEILNKQIVDRCDMCIALFARRLGTRTRSAESGTAEEIERLGEAGKYVGILRSRRPVDPVTNLTQFRNLEKYLSGISDKALIMPYADDAELAAFVNMILAAAVSSEHARSLTELGHTRYAEVWPRVEHEVKPSVTARGTTYRNWYLVLANTGNAAARDVRVRTERINPWDEPWELTTPAWNGAADVEVLAPNGELRFPIRASAENSTHVRCIVTWTDDRGEQSNTATVGLT